MDGLRPYEHVGFVLTTNAIDRIEAALLKDWVHRAVQIATERLRSDDDKVELRTDDFDVALREAQSSGQGASARIIGFLGESSSSL